MRFGPTVVGHGRFRDRGEAVPASCCIAAFYRGATLEELTWIKAGGSVWD
jgi:hypothetical protein